LLSIKQPVDHKHIM